MRFIIPLFFALCVAACAVEGGPDAPLPPVVKCKPTWENRTFLDWRKRACSSRDPSVCEPMGRATMLVEFSHGGCRSQKQIIDNQAKLVQGYSPAHLFIFISTESDPLTKALFDTGKKTEAPCRMFFYDDTIKADKKAPNEDQMFVELCGDVTQVADQECISQLVDRRLYTP